MKNIEHLNRILADNAGRTPQGDPMFKWVEARNLRHAVQTGQDTYDWVPAIDGERWVLAKWQAPPDKDEWDRMFRGALPYPRRGEYVPTDVKLREGFEPNEWVTGEAVNMVNTARALNYKGHLRSIQERLERIDEGKRRRMSDCIDDAITAFSNPFPGSRGGHVSFGGI
jgi:hypothetical protein